jgi:hypothetical protein
MQETNNNSQHIKKNTSVDYKYICIKKDVFDPSMIFLNYSSLKHKKYIEIIYKSPSVFLEGLFFKTPPISSKDIFIYYKDNKNYQSTHPLNNQAYNISNPTIKLLLNHQSHTQFINILRTIDEYISTYINKYAIEIENDLVTYYNDNRTMTSFNYEQIIKYRYNNIIEIHMKSYLDKFIIDELENKIEDNKYIFTFNISNIYFSNNNNLLPLVKCNRCESI